MPRRRPVPAALAAALALGALSLAAAGPSPARAAAVTDVIDGFPRGGDDPVDVNVSVRWDLAVRSGTLTREFRCLSNDRITGGGGELCPDASRVLDADELEVERRTQRLLVDVELGIFRHVQLSAHVPVVLFDQTKLTAAPGVNGRNSTIDPYNQPSLFAVPFTGAERAGLADPTFAVRFTPLSWARDRARPTWALQVALTAPVAAVKKASNEAVGEGIWALDLSTSLSARPMPWVEPYFKAGGILRFPGARSLFDDRGKTQTLVGPGHSMLASVGAELLPWENRRDEQAFVIDLGSSVEYRFEGREYTDLFEALGTSACDPRDPVEPCDLTSYDRLELDESTGRFVVRQTDGITDVEQYGLFRGWLGFRYQPVRYLQLRAQVDLAWESPHFLTFADAGRDLDGRNQVEQRNSRGVNEFNPVYDDAIDGLGRRIRSAGMFTWGLAFTLQGRF